MKTFVRRENERFHILMWIKISPDRWCVVKDNGDVTTQSPNGNFDWEPSLHHFDAFDEHE